MISIREVLHGTQYVSSQMKRMVLGMLPLMRNKYPAFLHNIGALTQDAGTKQAVTQTNNLLSTGVSALERIAREDRISEGEVRSTKQLFAEIAGRIDGIVNAVVYDRQLYDLLRMNFEDAKLNIDNELDAMRSATHLFATRFDAFVERRGGLAQLTELPTGIAGAALEGASMTPTTRGQQAAGLGMAVLLGPFAPLAMAGWTAARGVRGYFKKRAAQQDAMRMAALSPGLMGRRMGTGEGMGAERQGFKGWGTGIIDALRGVKPVGNKDLDRWDTGDGSVAKGGTRGRAGGKAGVLAMGLTRQAMTGAVISGLSMFNAAQAMRSGWTKKVLELLEKLRGGTPPPRFSFTMPMNWLLGIGGAIIAGILLAISGYFQNKTGEAWLGKAAFDKLRDPSGILRKGMGSVGFGAFSNMITGATGLMTGSAFLSPATRAVWNAARLVDKRLPDPVKMDVYGGVNSIISGAVLGTASRAANKIATWWAKRVEQTPVSKDDIAKIETEKRLKAQEQANADRTAIAAVIKEAMKPLEDYSKQTEVAPMQQMKKDVDEELLVAVDNGYNTEQ